VQKTAKKCKKVQQNVKRKEAIAGDPASPTWEYPTPSPVFWKCVQGKELREGVCESCVDKGLRRQKGKDVEEVKEVREAKERSILSFMDLVPQGKRVSGRRPGKVAAQEERQGVAAQLYCDNNTAEAGLLSRE
jgi:hypothetical protein